MKLDFILNLFNIREAEKEIFKICFESDGIGATEIAKKIGINRTSAYDFLDNLVKAGLIIESQKQGVKMFYAEKPEKIGFLIEEKQKEISQAKTAIKDLQAEFYLKKISTRPKLQIYEGREELRQMMRDMLLYRDITIRAFWPVKDIIKVLGEDFYKEFHRKRIERNIGIKVIWPAEQAGVAKNNFLENTEKLKREARIAPKNIDFKLGYTIYGNMVRFISSPKENYGFLIESQEMADTMKKQFELIWEQSKIIKSIKL